MTTPALTLPELEQHPDYRVLRRFRPRAEYGLLENPKIALFVDVEATGLNTEEDKIIQFAGARFQFDSAGNIGQIERVINQFEDPGVDLSPEIVELTGITNERVKGQRINDADVAAIMDNVVLVIAHYAEYDRKMVERRFAGFADVAWACSQRDVKWERFGVHGVKLDYLLMMLCGEFHAAHDALQDCLAGVHVLAHPRLPLEQLELERREVSPFQMLLESAREPTFRLFANESPFHTKDRLRLRRYRWHPDPIKTWAKDVKASELEAERAWLIEHVYMGVCDRSSTEKISARDRYSVRAS